MDRRQAREFESFAATSGDSLLRMAFLLTGDEQAAQDLCQETLQRLASRWGRLDSPLAFGRRTLHNLVIDRARARQRRPPEQELPAVLPERGDPGPADYLAAIELRPALLAALDTLTAQQRAIVVLRYFDDRSEAETADLLGVSAGTVKSTASRAVARLRDHPALTDLFIPTQTHGRPDHARH